jgi:hypothetical protein
MKSIYSMHSRKQQLSIDRNIEIEKRNKELYAKMSAIFKNGAGNVSPVRTHSQGPGEFEYSCIKVPRNGSRMPDFGNLPGNNLVTNRKSLNVESNRMTQNKIKQNNLKFLRRLQNLKSNYPTDDYICQHRDRGHLVERISKFPLVLDHNCDKIPQKQLPII